MSKKTLVQPGQECTFCQEIKAADIRIYSRHPIRAIDFMNLIEGLLKPFPDFYVGGMSSQGQQSPSPLEDAAADRIFKMIDEEKNAPPNGLSIDITGWEEVN